MFVPLSPTLPSRPGSFIIRHSDSTPGDFALTFRTKDETRHWKIAANQGKYYVHPRPQPYDSLEEIVDVSPPPTCTYMHLLCSCYIAAMTLCANSVQLSKIIMVQEVCMTNHCVRNQHNFVGKSCIITCINY